LVVDVLPAHSTLLLSGPAFGAASQPVGAKVRGGHCRFVAGTLQRRPGGMTIEIRVLGRFSVRRDGVEIPAGAFRGRLVRSLVRLLVTRRGSFVSRDLLIEALWPAGAPADPDLNLNVLVTRARNALGAPSLILTGPGGYSFAGAGACSVDAESFLEFVASGRMTDALALWGGEPLAEDAYADWAQDYRDRLNRAHL